MIHPFPRTLCGLGGFLAVVALAAPAVADGSSSPRSLPSLVTDWRWDGEAELMEVDGDEVVVLGSGLVTALDASDGEVRWQQTLCDGESRLANGLVVTEERVVAACADRLAVLDRRDGAVVARHELRVFRLAGPPPVARIYRGEDDEELVAVDPESGAILGRRQATSFSELAAHEGLIVIAVEPADDSDTPFLVGLDGKLEQRWRLAANRYTFFEEWRGEILVRTLDPDDVSRFYPLDVRRGALGDPLPRRQQIVVSGGLDWEYQIIDLSEVDATVTLRRNDPESGRPLWTVDLPGHPSAWAEHGDEVVFHCEPPAGRGTLVKVDRRRGEVVSTAYGLRAVETGHLDGDRWILAHDGGVAAVRLDRFGPPETSLHSIAEEVERILARLDGENGYYFEITEAAGELQALGPDALPVAADLLTGAEGPRLSALAKLVGVESYYPAASALVEHLQRMMEAESDSAHDDDRVQPGSLVLEALTRVAGPSEAPLLARIVRDPALADLSWLDARARWRVLAALGRVASDTALDVVAEIGRAAQPSESWWRPFGAEILERAGSDGLREEIRQAEQVRDWKTLHELEQVARAVVVEDSSGSRRVVFADGRYGGPNDLWLISENGGGAAETVFVGSLAPEEESSLSRCSRLRARMEERNLEVGCAEGGFPTHRHELDELARDADGDGLPDLLEEKLHLDPRRADSDGDGVFDAVDPAPNATAGEPESEDERIVHTIFEQFFLLSGDSGGLAIVESDRALEWRGRRGPTLTFDSEDEEEFRRRAGLNGIAYVRIVPIPEGDEEAKEFWGTVELETRERHYALSLYRGPLNAVGYTVVVRSVGDHWVITRLEMAWIS